MGMENEHEKLLVRVDERTLHTIGLVDKLTDMVESAYVTKSEFNPVRSVVYGMVGFMLISCLGAIIAMIIKK